MQEMIFLFTSAVVALFPVINPVGTTLIVNGYLEGLNDADRKKAVRKIIMYSLCIGLGCVCLGHFILKLFGLAIPVIQTGGGILICKTGFEWLNDSGAKQPDASVTSNPRISLNDLAKKLFYPITFPITVGAGTISVIFTLLATGSVEGDFLQTALNYFIIVLAFVSLCVVLYLALYQGPRIMSKLNEATAMVINKLIAFITFAIGIQIMVTGIGHIFHIKIL